MPGRLCRMTKTAQRWSVDQIPDQTGRVAIVTGANSGLGFATTKALAAHGARVIMAVRNAEKGRAAVAALRAGQPDADLDLRPLDLADLDSVHAFADAIGSDGVTIDLLINNAGVMMPPRSLSPQGNESQFAANHLGHFALTGRLLDALRTGGDARVVTVSSTAHKVGRIHFDDLTGERKYSPMSFYGQSKFANAVFGLEFDRRLRAAGRDIQSVLAHPGYSNTNLQTSGPTGLSYLVMKVGNPLFGMAVDQGALNQLYAATAPGDHSGEFIGPDGLFETRGYPKVVQPVASAKDPELGRRLWTLSEELTGVTYNLPASV
jgi:NAD(P)-dependent dehydrogenase (short-subunit alcohol dehydrogenase family)